MSEKLQLEKLQSETLTCEFAELNFPRILNKFIISQ